MELESDPIKSDADGNAKKKKRGRMSRHARRIVVYSLLAILSAIALADYWLETRGLPAALEPIVLERLRDNGIEISFDKARCGIIRGVVLTNPKIRDPGYSERVVFSADKISFSIASVIPFGNDLAVSNNFNITNGVLSVPLFPEAGEEGLADTLEISNFNASGTLTQKGLEVRSLSGQLGPFKFTMAGTLRNIFHPRKKRNSKKKHRPSTTFSLAPLAKQIPFDMRAKIHKAYLLASKKGFFQGTPSCNAVFRVDANNTKAHYLMAHLNLPPFRYSGVEVEAGKLTISFKDGELTLEELDMALTNGSTVRLSGKYHPENDRLSVRIEGRLESQSATSLVKHIAPDAVDQVKFGAKPATFKASLENFSFTTLNINGDAQVEIPSATIKGLNVENLALSLTFMENKLEIKKLSFDTPVNHVEGTGVFLPNEQSIDVDAWCYGPPLFVPPFLEGVGKKNANAFFAQFKFPKDKTKVRLDAKIHVSWYDKLRYYVQGPVTISAPFKYNAANFDSGHTYVAFDETNLFIVPDMTLRQGDSTAHLALVYEENDGASYQVSSKYFASKSGPVQRAVLELRSNLPGTDVLGCVLPDVHLDALDISHEIDLTATGLIDLTPANKTNFSMDIIDASIAWNSIPLKRLNCELLFQGSKMIVKGAKAKVHTGDLAMDLTCDFSNDSGSFNGSLKDADFKALSGKLGWNLKSEKGKISAKAKADYSHDKKGSLLLHGGGSIAIRDADIWEVPFVSDFGKIITPSVGGHLGVISSFDADFTLDGTRLQTKNAKTNGDVVALTAKGNYYWNSGDFKFVIRAKMLKRALPYEFASKIFSPLSGLFQTTVSRKNGRVRWKKLTLMDKIIDGAGRWSDPNL